MNKKSKMFVNLTLAPFLEDQNTKEERKRESCPIVALSKYFSLERGRRLLNLWNRIRPEKPLPPPILTLLSECNLCHNLLVHKV